MEPIRRKVAVAGVVALAVAGVAQGVGALAASGDPQVSLRVASATVEVERIEGDPFIWAPLGTYVGVTGGPLLVEALPGADGNADLWRVRRDSAGGIHRISRIQTPTRGLMFLGLPDFVNVTLKSPSGAVVSQQSLAFCPAGGFFGGASMARLDTSGPDEPTLPNSCGSELTRHIVFGLDQGWASSVGNELLSNFTGPDGDYRVDLAIAPTYVEQLAIPAAQAHGSLTLTVTTIPCPYDPEFCPGGGGGGGGGVGVGLAGAGPGGVDTLVRSAAADVNARAARTATLASSPALRTLSDRANPTRTGQPDANNGRRAKGLPDLVPLPAFGISVRTDETGRDQLGFGANLANLGAGPLVVEGYRQGAEHMVAKQFEYRDGTPVKVFPVGEFEWDEREGHHHWHFEDAAQYDLVAADGSLQRSGKQSFCLAPTDPIDLTRPGAVQQVDSDRMWSMCGGSEAIWIREVLPAGWGDTYYQGVAGQAFDITDLANGVYTIRITSNVSGRLHESSTSNNVSTKKVELGGTPGARTVTELG
ncbi:lysyl oxidase family protein [Intrasporangium mesophilum]